jgi:putative transposase
MIEMRRKRHSPAEIASKLLASDRMAASGMLQSEIARALDVSVMTYHRWRKSRKQTSALHPDQVEPNNKSIGAHGNGDLLNRNAELHSELHSELHIENSRLRRLVTDLLLEVDRLEEKIALLPWADGVAAAPHRKAREQLRRPAKRRSESGLVGGKIR